MANPEWRPYLEKSLDAFVCTPTHVLDQQTAVFQTDTRGVVLKNIFIILSEVGILVHEADLGASGGFLSESPAYTAISIHSKDITEAKIACTLRLVGHLDLCHLPHNHFGLINDVSLSNDPSSFPIDELLKEHKANRWAWALIDRVTRQPQGQANPVILDVLRWSADILLKTKIT